MQDFVFSNGLVIPKGVSVCVSSGPMQTDEVSFQPVLPVLDTYTNVLTDCRNTTRTPTPSRDSDTMTSARISSMNSNLCSIRWLLWIPLTCSSVTVVWHGEQPWFLRLRFDLLTPYSVPVASSRSMRSKLFSPTLSSTMTSKFPATRRRYLILSGLVEFATAILMLRSSSRRGV